MKLIRFGNEGQEKPGVHIDGINYDVCGFIHDYNEGFFANGGLPHLAWMLEQHKGMMPKVAGRSKIGIAGCKAIKNYLYWIKLCRSCKRNQCNTTNRASNFYESYHCFMRPF